jgi:ribosomal protein S18 acetylase RimI-like enzyme
MKLDDQRKFPPQAVTLRDGAKAVVRPLTEADGGALADFYEGIPAEDGYFYQPHPLTRENALNNASRASSPTEVVLVLETPAGGIGGYAWYRWGEGSALSCFGICVARAFQGTGAGQQLMVRLQEIARTVGPEVMMLTVQKKNPKAVQLYTKMGFQIVREQIRADGEPEYYMERRVR